VSPRILAIAMLCTSPSFLAICAETSRAELWPRDPVTHRASWMKKGVITASSMEPLTFYQRRGGSPVNIAEKWNAERSEAAVRQLRDIGVNLVIVNLHKGAGLIAEHDDIEATRRLVGIAHRHGLKVGGYVGASMLYETMYVENPAARDWRQIDEYGRPIYYTADQTFRHMACRNNPGYQAFVQKILHLGVVDLKLDLIHFDQLMWWPEPLSCHCRHCAGQFREYLKERYQPPLGKERFGYSFFNGVTPPPYNLPAGAPVRFSELRNPLMQEWARFRAWSLSKRYGEYDRYIHKLNPDAVLIGNPTMNIDSNVGFMYGVDLQQLLEHGDAIWSEEPNLASWTDDGVLVSKIRSYKAARTMGKPLFRWQGSPVPYIFKEPVELRLAEAIAYNDNNLGVVAGGDVGGNVLPANIKRFVDFFREHSGNLTDTRSTGDVAVLRSFSSIEFNPAKSNFSTVLFEQTLIQAKIPFSIIFDRHLRQLSRFKVIVLANQDALSDEQLEQIRRFVTNGGGVVATENTAMLTDWRRPRMRPGIADLLGLDSSATEMPERRTVQHRFGTGRVVYVPQIQQATQPPTPEMSCFIPNRLWKLPRNYADLVSAVRWAADDRLTVSVDAPLHVTMELAHQQSTNTFLLHLVNFNMKTRVSDVLVRFRVPAGFHLEDVSVESPDWDGKQRVPFKTQDDVATLTVPQLQVYDLVLLKLRAN